MSTTFDILSLLINSHLSLLPGTGIRSAGLPNKLKFQIRLSYNGTEKLLENQLNSSQLAQRPPSLLT